MKRIFFLLIITTLLTGCFESVALVGGASNGRALQSSFQSAVSYGIKTTTGKSPIEHVLSYKTKKNPEQKKEACVSFLENSTSEVCYIAKKQISTLKNSIKEKSKIKNLD